MHFLTLFVKLVKIKILGQNCIFMIYDYLDIYKETKLYFSAFNKL